MIKTQNETKRAHKTVPKAISRVTLYMYTAIASLYTCTYIVYMYNVHQTDLAWNIDLIDWWTIDIKK